LLTRHSVIALPEAAKRKLAPAERKIFFASHTVYVMDKYNPGFDDAATHTAHSTPVHSLNVSRNQNRFRSVAVGDWFINDFLLEEDYHLAALVAESDVFKVSVFKGPLLRHRVFNTSRIYNSKTNIY
jgi:hypothetical protein